MDGRKEVFYSLLGDFTYLESAVTFWRKCVGIESNERVLRIMLLKRIVKGEKAGEVSCIRN